MKEGPLEPSPFSGWLLKRQGQPPRSFERELCYLPVRARRSHARVYLRIFWPISDRPANTGLSERHLPTRTRRHCLRFSPRKISDLHHYHYFLVEEFGSVALEAGPVE